jgi:hypothetical protein
LGKAASWHTDRPKWGPRACEMSWQRTAQDVPSTGAVTPGTSAPRSCRA